MKLTLLLFAAAPLFAQSQELALSLGTLRGNSAPSLTSGLALQANYAIRLAPHLHAAVNLLANPQRRVAPASPNIIRDVASLYLTPELQCRWRFAYAYAGAGLAVYEHSTLTASGAPNPGPRTANTGTLTYGAGANVPITRRLALRAEARDNFSGPPVYNVPATKQHNVSLTAGFVLRWGH